MTTPPESPKTGTHRRPQQKPATATATAMLWLTPPNVKLSGVALAKSAGALS
ncbi:hypothetical protein Metal_2589 [Methylomicrobium album BG8]|uniref:Uncharacterized protein n=1 Tax=Methylomicrobium album BG8 TaxID=686340 RepID=H8GIW4_METAL|nr:hypothetical protein Metal_2589 [Methylomicrobium album BG8]